MRAEAFNVSPGLMSIREIKQAQRFERRGVSPVGEFRHSPVKHGLMCATFFCDSFF